MLNICLEILNGFIHSLLSLKTLIDIYKQCFKQFIFLILINVGLLYIPKYINSVYDNTLSNIIYNIYIGPIFIVCYIFSLDIFNQLFKFLNNSKNQTISINVLLYFNLVSLIYYLIINLLLYIPYIGLGLGMLFTSHSYGYYCLEYSSFFNNIKPIQKISLIENNPYFFIGYGSILGLSVLYLPFIEHHLLFLSLFPINTIYLTQKKNLYSNSNDILSKVFIIPIYILNFFLNVITKYLNL